MNTTQLTLDLPKSEIMKAMDMAKNTSTPTIGLISSKIIGAILIALPTTACGKGGGYEEIPCLTCGSGGEGGGEGGTNTTSSSSSSSGGELKQCQEPIKEIDARANSGCYPNGGNISVFINGLNSDCDSANQWFFGKPYQDDKTGVNGSVVYVHSNQGGGNENVTCGPVTISFINDSGTFAYNLSEEANWHVVNVELMEILWHQIYGKALTPADYNSKEFAELVSYVVECETENKNCNSLNGFPKDIIEKDVLKSPNAIYNGCGRTIVAAQQDKKYPQCSSR